MGNSKINKAVYIALGGVVAFILIGVIASKVLL